MNGLILMGTRFKLQQASVLRDFKRLNDKTLADLLIRADKALYSAKSAGKNQVVVAVDREFVLHG